MQNIVDIWDGYTRSLVSSFLYTTAYTDVLLNLYKEDYLSTDATTYAQIGGATSSNYMYCGFSERTTGLMMVIPDASYVNVVPATVMSIDYWNGGSWVSVGQIDDGTSLNGRSMNHSGMVTWNAPSSSLEFTTSVGNSTLNLYYYRIHFNNTLTADVRVDYIASIPAQKLIKAHVFPLLWQNRLWMCCEKSQLQNTMTCTQSGTVSVLNGTDSTTLSIGDGNSILAGGTLFTRFGGSLYDNAIIYKQSSVHLIDGTSPSDYRVYDVATDVGIAAVNTLQNCEVSYESAPGITKHVHIWRSSRGIELFDGNAITTISTDIRIFFDPDNARYINQSMVDKETSHYDQRNFRYHWRFASGANTTLNEEWAYDLILKKWFEIKRGTKGVTHAWTVEDPMGIKHIYAGGTTGYIWRLENGASFDGETIPQTFWTGDYNVAGSMNYVSRLRHIKLVGKSKNTSTSKVSVGIYIDGDYTPISLRDISQVSTKRIYQAKRSIKVDATTMSFKGSVSTNNENVGFEPIIVSGLYENEREDVQESQ